MLPALVVFSSIHSVPFVVNICVVAVLVYSTPLRIHSAGLSVAVTTAPVTGICVESERTLRKAPPDWPVMTQTVLIPVEVAVTLGELQVVTRLPFDAVVNLHTVTAKFVVEVLESD